MPPFYETLFIVRPTADDDTLQGTITAVREHVAAAGGDMLLENTWGKRKLAYDVGPFSEGVYVQMHFSAEPTYPPALERVFRLNEDVIRSLVVRADGPPPEEVPEYLRAEPEPDHAPEDAEHAGADDHPRPAAPPAATPPAAPAPAES